MRGGLRHADGRPGVLVDARLRKAMCGAMTPRRAEIQCGDWLNAPRTVNLTPGALTPGRQIHCIL